MVMVSRVPGQVIGVPGGSLSRGSNAWAANDEVAEVGRGGELRTAAVLNSLASNPGGPTVLHDLRVPGSSANVDHVVVSGRTVTVVDTKVWKPGTYVSVAGRVFRDWSRFRFGDKAAMGWMVVRLRSALPSRARFRRPVLVVWPSKPGQLKLRWFRLRGTTVVTGGRLVGGNAGRVFGSEPADPEVVAALMPLVCDRPGGHLTSSAFGAGGDVEGSAGGHGDVLPSTTELQGGESW